MIIKQDQELNLIYVKEIVSPSDKMIIFSDIDEFLKLVAMEAAIYVTKAKELIQLQEGAILVLEDGVKKLEKISTE